MATIKGGFSLKSYIDYGIGSELRTGSVRALIESVVDFTNGTSDGKIDVAWDDQRTLASGANEDLDFAGSLTDLEGAAVTFAKIKVLIIRNTGTAAVNALSIKPAASNGFDIFWGAAAHTNVIRGGGILLLYAPLGAAVVAGTGDKLNLAAAGGTSIVYDIIALGTSA